MTSVRLDKLVISECSAVDDPANLTPGWLVMKSAAVRREALAGDAPQPLYKVKLGNKTEIITRKELIAAHAALGAHMAKLKDQIDFWSLPDDKRDDLTKSIARTLHPEVDWAALEKASAQIRGPLEAHVRNARHTVRHPLTGQFTTDKEKDAADRLAPFGVSGNQHPSNNNDKLKSGSTRRKRLSGAALWGQGDV